MNKYQLLIIEIAMKKEDPELFDIYFGNNAILHYQEPPINDDYYVAFLIVGIKKGASEEATVEFMLNCPGFKKYHEMLLERKVKTYLVTENQLKKINKWHEYFHPNGKYR